MTPNRHCYCVALAALAVLASGSAAADDAVARSAETWAVSTLGTSIYPARFCRDRHGANNGPVAGHLRAAGAPRTDKAVDPTRFRVSLSGPGRRTRLALWSLFSSEDSDVFLGITRSGIVGLHVDVRNVLPTSR